MKVLRNHMEETVRKYVSEWLPKYDVCQCDDCYMDILALIMNKMPPSYTVSDKGGVFASIKKLDFQFQATIATEMALAVELVSKNPSHQLT
ncbi:MAG: late competence development ComFB family protein [Defluviitaleaceae bacterium]|nr:late competence development ComFB family protein [Defluviitaleaceae bacterium]